MHKRTPDQLIVVGICIICLAGLIPFTFIRFFSGEYIVALIDLIGALASFGAIRYVWKTGRTKRISSALAMLALVGMTANVVLLGFGDIYFLYPVFISAFFLTAPSIALVAVLISTLIISHYLASTYATLEVIKVACSLSATALFTFIFAVQRNRQRDALQQLSRTDALTGAGNRLALRDKIEEGIATAKRDNHPMSLLIIDLDDFKKINDHQGHLVGDQVLKALADRIRSRIRASDQLYRFGGDEFMVLANHSGAETAYQLALDLRSLIDAKAVVDDIFITVSIGVSQYQPGETADQWFARADTAMYGAKAGGKNQVIGAEVAAL